MLLLKVLLLLLVGVSNIIFAVLVLSKGVRKLTNISFFTAAIGMAGWVIGIALYLLSNDAPLALSLARIYYFFPLLIGVGILFFALSFPHYKRIRPLTVVSVLAGFFALTGLLVFRGGFLTLSIAYHDWGKEVVFDRFHYAVYSVFLFLTYGSTLGITLYKSRVEKGIYRAQASMFFWGFLITFIIGVGFNLVLPWFGNYQLIWIGPYCTAVFMIAIAYSIVKHHMFNIRSVVARSVAYLLSIVVLTVIYTSLVYTVALLFEDGSIRDSSPANFINAVLIALMVPLYGPMKRFFDKVTNRFFYRDAYSSQRLINQLNEILVRTSNAGTILRKSSDLLEKTIKIDAVGFILLPSLDSEAKFICTNKGMDRASNLALLRELEEVKQAAVYVDDTDPVTYTALRDALNREGWALSLRLVTNNERVGYLLMGQKRSGSSYSDQDRSVLNIVADALALAIQNSLRYDEISRFNETLKRNIDDATKELRRTNEKLKALDATKDEFISMASHQLRTPLTSVKGYLSMVLEGDTGKLNAHQEKLLQQAFTSSQRMVYLISDLLNVSRLRTGKFVIERVPTNLPAIIQGEIDQLKETAEVRGLKLKFTQPKNFPLLHLDETKIRQVIMNFIDNAIYYTPQGGKITVELEEKPQAIELRVIDTGIGVPKRYQHELFGKFYRAENARRVRPDGTGLGLFMAKKVIIAQGGATIFRSIEGKGSTFGFTFPKNKLKIPEKA